MPQKLNSNVKQSQTLKRNFECFYFVCPAWGTKNEFLKYIELYSSKVEGLNRNILNDGDNA